MKRTALAEVLAVALACAASVAAAHEGWGGLLRGLDASHARQAVSVAEALADIAEMAEERPPVETDIVDWLLSATASDPAAVDAALGRSGYDGPAEWVEEMLQVLAAHDAVLRGDELRSSAEIAAELERLPVVPLDERGEARRDALITEYALATVPAEDVEAVLPLRDHLVALRARIAGMAAP